jgi:hypothetical protein
VKTNNRAGLDKVDETGNLPAASRSAGSCSDHPISMKRSSHFLSFAFSRSRFNPVLAPVRIIRDRKKFPRIILTIKQVVGIIPINFSFGGKNPDQFLYRWANPGKKLYRQIILTITARIIPDYPD